MSDGKEDDLTRRMIDEGARMLADEGYAGLSMRKLAAVCGTSTMTVYTRFGDKTQLLAAMYRAGFERLGERMRTAAGEPLTSLAEVGRAYRLAALDSRNLYGLMFGTRPADLTPEALDDDAAAATYTPLVRGVQAAVDAGLLVGDPARIARHLWVVAHGMVSLEISGRLPLAPLDAAAAYDDALALAAQPFLKGPTR